MGNCCCTSSADADAYWIEEQPCQCSRQYSFTTSLETDVVPITIRYCCCEFGGRREAVVKATIKCDSCGHQFRRTYELRYKRKHKRWGYYGKHFPVKDQSVSAERFSFAHLEQCYEIYSYDVNKSRMRPYYHWAKGFYELVTAGEQKCACKM